jgi:hypothetical protein
VCVCVCIYIYICSDNTISCYHSSKLLSINILHERNLCKGQERESSLLFQCHICSVRSNITVTHICEMQLILTMEYD